MAQDKSKRKLTSILGADVAGYRRLMDEDEVAMVNTQEQNKGIMSEPIRQHRSRAKVFLGIFLILVLISACGGKMSVEEARKIAISISDNSPVAPPRRIDDILATLNQGGQGDFAVRQNLRAEIEKPPPQTDNLTELAAYYHRRGFALYQMGQTTHALADLRLALHYSSQGNIKDNMLIHRLAFAEFGSGNYKKAIEYLEQALNLREEPAHHKGLVNLYARVGDLDSAERVANQGISFCNRVKNQQGWGNWPVIHAADMKAYVLEAQARFAEAEPYYRQVLQNWSPSMRKQYPFSYAIAKLYLSRNLKYQDRLVEAEVVCRDYLSELGALNKDSEVFGHGLSELGEILVKQGRLPDAEKLMRTSVRLLEDANVASESYLMADARMRLGEVLAAEEKYDEAMQQFDLAKKNMQQNQYVYENYFARNPALMLSLIQTGRIEEAAIRISEMYAKHLQLFGEKNYLTGEALGFRGMVQALQKNEQDALNDFSHAFPILFEQSSSGTLSYDRQIRRRIITESYLDLLVRQRRGTSEKDDGADAAAEAFKVSDALSASAVRTSIGASIARAAVTSPELGDLARREQDARKQLKVLEQALLENLAAPAAQQLTEVINELKLKMDSLNRACMVLVDDIDTRFPKYAELINPKPLSVARVQQHLRRDEVFVAIYTSGDNSYVWAIPHQGRISFSVVPLGKAKLSQMVAGLRKALDPKPVTLGDIPEFDTATAFDLYRRLLKPVETVWQGAKDLLVVAHGPLGHLPFSVLPTAPVRLAEDESELFSKYRQVPWLVRNISLARLPSAATFVSLRSISAGDSSRRAFAGFGDPFFNQQQLAEALEEKEKTMIVAAGKQGHCHVRGIRISDGGLLDSDIIISCTISQLSRLPDTSAEIVSIAEALGADPVHDVFLGKRASERQVKSMDLSDRRVIAFATHALVPGDLDGLDQPALALCSPSISGESEDGLLTMGEIVRLNLNADWVVLSACNTGAADGKGAEAVSGLGQAFFYAGTRAILVSLWPVETTSARELTSGLFRYQQVDQTLSRAGALQKSALALIDGLNLKDHETDKIAASYAHPIFWAPFILVGESSRNPR